MNFSKASFILTVTLYNVLPNAFVVASNNIRGGSATSPPPPVARTADSLPPVNRRRQLEMTTVCTNTAAYDGQDDGCPADMPICMLDTGYEPSAQATGSACGKCVNSVNSDIFADTGCEASAKMCNAALGLVGTACEASETVYCTNTGTGGDLDEGCSEEAPICIDSQTGGEVGYMAPGNECVPCLNSFSTLHNEMGVNDYGCGDDAPRCMTADDETDPFLSKYGTQCCSADGECTHDCSVDIGPGLCTDSSDIIFDACGFGMGDCTEYAEADENAIGWIYLSDTYCVVLYMDSYIDGKSADEVCDPDYVAFFSVYSGEGEIEASNGAGSYHCYACE